VRHELQQDTEIIVYYLSSRRRERSNKVLISYKIPHIRSGWHDKTHDSRVYITTKMISVDKNVKEGFKW